MLNIDGIFQASKPPERLVIDSGDGITHDIMTWCDLYRKHLINSGKSQNTISQYDVTLKGLREFSTIYWRYSGRLSDILNNINDFLEWMEEYEISKKYGSIRERVSELISFLSSSGVEIENYLAGIDPYFRMLDDSRVATAEYAILDFHKFLTKNGINEISNQVIRTYVDKRKKLSMTTMEQRRIAIIAFLKFIDKSIGEEHFSPNFWKIRHYKKEKGAHSPHTGFTDVDDTAIEKYLRLDSEHPSIDGGWKYYSEIRTKAMIVLMKKAGLRASEALWLKFEDVEIGKNGDTYVLNVLGKGNKRGRVPISKSIFEPYFEQLRAFGMGDYLSSTRRGSPMARTNLYISVKNELKKNGVSQTGLHIFRHHFGSTFAAKNGNIKILQQLLRHSNITTTMIYSTVNEDVLAEAVLQ